jgi:cytochrome c peroxidase
LEGDRERPNRQGPLRRHEGYIDFSLQLALGYEGPDPLGDLPLFLGPIERLPELHQIELRVDDLYVFRVASLRNVAMTPYFHDGSVATLPEAAKVMARVQLGMTVVVFLESLTGELPANFTMAPVLPSSAVVPAK